MGCRWAAPVVWCTSCGSERSATRFAAATRNGVLRSRYVDWAALACDGLVCALFGGRTAYRCLLNDSSGSGVADQRCFESGALGEESDCSVGSMEFQELASREILAKKHKSSFQPHSLRAPSDAVERQTAFQNAALIDAGKRRRRRAREKPLVHDAIGHPSTHSSHGVAGAAAARLRRARVRPIAQQVEAGPPPPLDERWG